MAHILSERGPGSLSPREMGDPIRNQWGGECSGGMRWKRLLRPITQGLKSSKRTIRKGKQQFHYRAERGDLQESRGERHGQNRINIHPGVRRAA